MTATREIAGAYANNGYMPIPADCTAKMPKEAWSDHYEHYDFTAAWKNYYDCDVALILKNLVCVDFDKHGEGKTGRDYYDMIQKEYPQIFKGCIIEQTQNDGIHAYFKRTVDMPDKEWKFPANVDGETVYIEVKTGKKLAYCYPSKKKGAIAYVLLQGSFEDIPVNKLPALPSIFRYFAPAKPKPIWLTNKMKTDMTPEQRTAAISVIVDIYQHNARHDGTMHNGGLGLAGYMAGLGYSDSDISRALRSYEGYGHRAFRPHELDDIISYGMSHPDRDAKPPFKRLKNA